MESEQTRLLEQNSPEEITKTRQETEPRIAIENCNQLAEERHSDFHRRVATLHERIKRCHAEAEKHERSALEAGIQCGKEMRALRKEIKLDRSARWLPYCEEHFPEMSESKIRRYMRLAEFVEENAENQSSMTDFHNCESLNEAYEFIQEFNEHRDSASGDKQGEVHSQRETKQERKQKSRLLTIQGYANKMLPLLPDGNTPEPDEDKIYETLGFAEDWRIHYRKKKETIAERAARVEEGMKEIAV